ncbi:MAG: tRNA (adenosine(37)-N6)-dimethylallyltransferase MiaA [Anaerolineae bacterium]
MAEQHPPLIVIVGPTGIGKTRLAVDLAQRLGGEIVSADSRQVYRGMDIGTAKPSAEERRLAAHHLIDILDPDQWLSLAEFQKMAYRAIDAIHARGRLPLLVGGTGQYVRAVVDGWGIPEVEPHHGLRADLESYAALYGASALHSRLREVDPHAADAIDYRNVRRVVRALEVYLVSGEPISRLQEQTPPPYRILQIGLTMPREALYRRVDCRVDAMIAAGWVDEMRRLLAAGYSWELPAMSSLGYPQIAAHLRGELTLEEAAAIIKRETHRFIRQQYNWFSPGDPAIHWFDVDQDPADAIAALAAGWLVQQA